MSLTLTWRAATAIPVDGSVLRPEMFLDSLAGQASRTRLAMGNTTMELGELFRVQGTRGDERLTVEGDLSHVHGLGREMSRGHLFIRGDVGPQLGAEMAGGTIEVDGSVGDWAGAEMRGGLITIRGNTGSFLGAAYPGSRLGMRDGAILIEGSTGDEAGLQMRRGLIAIRGSAGAGVGRSMIAGTVIVLGLVGRRIGAGMKRGTLVLPSLPRPPEEHLLPTFARAGRFRAPFLTLYFQQLRAWGFSVPQAVSTAYLDRYNGDMVVGGRGEILAGQQVV